MDDSSNPYSSTGGPTTSQAENASVTPIDIQMGSANTVPINSNPIANNPIVGTSSQRILARTIISSTSRGNQTSTAQEIINDTVTNNPAIVTSGITQNQTFSNPVSQDPLIVNGKQSDGTYGQRLFDLSGNVVAQFGQQTDGSVNLKIFASPTSPDTNIGLGLAQFGRFADGSTALKIALPGFDVGSATDNQLAFNSNTSILQATIPQVILTASHANYNAVIIPHNLPYTPVLQASAQVQVTYGVNSSTFFTITANVPLPYFAGNTLSSTGFSISANVSVFTIASFVDATNVYFSNSYVTNSGGGYTFPAIPISYSLLPNVANA